MKKNSYIVKMFTFLLIILVLVTMFMSISIYSFSKNIVSNEVVDLNSAILNQVSENTAWSIVDAVTLCNNISNDSSVIEFLSSPTGDEYNEQEKTKTFEHIENIISDYIWSRHNNKNLFEAYIVGYNGANYSTYSKKYSINDIIKNPKLRNALHETNQAVLVGTSVEPSEKGVYRYSFQVVKEIHDHITQESYGFVILNISENFLYSSYNDLITKNKEFVIIDQNGIVLSSKDKRMIGEKYIDFSKYIEQKSANGYITDDEYDGDSLFFYNRIEGTQWYLLEKMNSQVVWYQLKQIRFFIAGITIICIIIILFLSKYFSKKISEPIVSIGNKMKQVAQGNMDIRAVVKSDDEIGQIALSFNYMVEKISNLLDTTRDSERKKRLAELDFLRAQINPHFIYNTLSSIRFYIDMNKNKQAEDMLFYFSKILRKTLSRSDEFVPLSDELETIRDYVQLQMLRYPNSFEVDYEVSEEILDCIIPIFILQPIIENAIFYSVGGEGISQITIVGLKEHDNINIIIEDDGIGMSQEQIDKAFNKDLQVNKVGLKNVHERIQLVYGIDYGLTIKSSNGKGTKVIFKLPIQYIDAKN